jgi:LPXTG-site transpeptidase (sortase) family protein
MPNKSDKTKAIGRTREIPVVPQQEAHYELHIAPALQPHETPPKEKSQRDHLYHVAKEARTQSRGGNRVWRFMEWFATSALIFLVLFFALNFSSYYDLFKNKLDNLRGQYGLNPYMQELVHPSTATPTQQLLPLTANVDESRKQIPALAMDVVPPDDRIIIPRIAKNVPIVKVKTENLIKRDWNALEKDIQSALQDGVIHYPGTAYPGEHGNVVITGHSSYFIWDPGQFKDVFALLHQVSEGDTVIIYYNQQKYTYMVYEKQVVLPDQVDVLTQAGGDRLTLITCTPVGTNLKRLVVFAKPV